MQRKYILHTLEKEEEWNCAPHIILGVANNKENQYSNRFVKSAYEYHRAFLSI